MNEARKIRQTQGASLRKHHLPDCVPILSAGIGRVLILVKDERGA
jgi:hypothetical protein